jgi:Flp pilus assembly protein TadG
MTAHAQWEILRSECGASLVEMAIIMPLLLLIAFGVIDFGRAYYLVPEIAGAAHAGAIYGSQNPPDITGTERAAQLNAPDVSNLSATATWGCECSDGTNQESGSICVNTPPSCSMNVVYFVTVQASAAYSPLFPWPGIPSTIPLSKSTTIRGGTPF